MFGLGMSEIIFLAILALIVIGPKELPQLARTLGRFINELKRSSNILTDELKQQVRIDRLDLDIDSAMSRRQQVRDEEQINQDQSLAEVIHPEHGHPSDHPAEPQQMDLTEQAHAEAPHDTNPDSDENKKS
jgi:sec-independent protein translocase protein TatB